MEVKILTSIFFGPADQWLGAHDYRVKAHRPDPDFRDPATAHGFFPDSSKSHVSLK